MNTIRLVAPYHEIPQPSPAAAASGLCTIRMTVEAGALTLLRQLAARICGETLEFIRISACNKGRTMKVCLCVGAAFADVLLLAIMQRLPGAQLGRFCLPPGGRA